MARDSWSDERATPQLLYDELNAEFNFTCDLAASFENYKHSNYYSIMPPNSAFNHDWVDINWCNPPYSAIKVWLSYGRKQVNKHNSTIVWVLPMDGSTQWFHSFIWDKKKHQPRPGIQMRYPDKRYKFEGNSNSAKFATLIIVMTTDAPTVMAR
jgi:phage N-6-adenine-methyltransferase